jgi:hypothetical protein
LIRLPQAAHRRGVTNPQVLIYRDLPGNPTDFLVAAQSGCSSQTFAVIISTT